MLKLKNVTCGFVIAAALAVGLSACGSSSSSAGSSAGGSATTGQLVICNDPTYPPAEFLQSGRRFGFDVDVAQDLARRMHKSLVWVSVGFNGIIGALLSNQCDVILSALADTPKRAQTIAFVNEFNGGNHLLVPAGNPKHISTIATLAGTTVAAAVGTTSLSVVQAENDKLNAQGKQKIRIQTFPSDADALSALRAGKVDAYVADAAVLAYIAKQHQGLFEPIAGPSLEVQVGQVANAYALGFRKDSSALIAETARELKAMYRDGTMKRILSKWGIGYVLFDDPNLVKAVP